MSSYSQYAPKQDTDLTSQTPQGGLYYSHDTARPHAREESQSLVPPHAIQSSGVDSKQDAAISALLKCDEHEIIGKISIHGWMHKQGSRKFKGPVAKSWRKRYFALEGTEIYYFHDFVDCRKYFNSRNGELVVGAIDLKDAFKLEQSERLDLPARGIAIHTRHRVWLVCPETEADFRMWFDALELTIMTSGSGNVVKRELPNVRVYHMKGRSTYRIIYVLFVIAALAELAAIVLWFPLGIEPCDIRMRNDTCEDIQDLRVSTLRCSSTPFNGHWNPPDWYKSSAGISDVQCFRVPRIGHWIAYICFYLSEFISILLGFLYYLGMWNPVRRGAQYLRDFKPHFDPAKWPSVDIMLCHYAEPAEDTIATLEKIINLDYPSHLYHVWVCDDGYCKSKWGDGVVPQVSVNRGVIENAGDVRREIAQFMYERVCESDDIEVEEWRKQHTTVKMPTDAHPRVVNRMDCAVGSVRDDYNYQGFPKITFVGRIKPSVHHSKAGNINNVLYNEGASGRYCIILDNDMKPHEMFIQAVLPFFFDQPENAKVMHCCAPGCSDIGKICCSLCKKAGVPDSRISYCSKDCFKASNHIKSSLHRRQTQNTINERMVCATCDGDINKKLGVCKKCRSMKNARASSVDAEFVRVTTDDDYSDHVSVNQVGYVQTPQYFEDCLQIRLGDPCGHRNSTFFDSAQTGMDGYECASFAGTNAIFRREALDSVNGIQYGSLTEDALTGSMMIDKGWKGLYFRKDLEGEESERIRLAEGAVPETVAAALAQRKRWAKGNFQIYLRKKRSMIDPEWIAPQVELPKPRKTNRFMRWVFFMNLTIYPIGSFPAIFFFYVTAYFLYTGNAPIYTSGLRLLLALMPKILLQSILTALSNRTVENNDIMRSQQTWFSYAFVHVIAVFDAIYWKITDKEAAWANTGALGGNSIMEIPNLLVFLCMVFGILWAIVRFFCGYNNAETTHGAPLLFASVFFGIFTASQLGPMVRMSLQTYFGWSHKSLTDQGNIFGSLSLVMVIIILCFWVYVETPNRSIMG